MRHISTTSLDLQWHLDRVVYCTGLQNLGSWVRIPQVPNLYLLETKRNYLFRTVKPQPRLELFSFDLNELFSIVNNPIALKCGAFIRL